MIVFSLQIVLLIAAGVGLLRLWRAAVPTERWLQLVVAAGFLSRALLGQALFWISWAHLPIARSLQLGDGYWVFAQDATFYFPEAVSAADKGLRAIVMLDRGGASPMYVQTLATAVLLFGRAVAVGVLINLFCYLGTIAILVHWGRKQPRARTATALAIAAVSLSPAFVLWSLQPLKDPLFQFLFVAFVATCAAWQRAWLARGEWPVRIGTGALLVILLFAVAGLRWYFAAVLLVAASLFLLLVVFKAAERKSVALAAAAAVVFLLSLSLVASAEPYLPPTLLHVLAPATAAKTAFARVEQARQAFESSPADTAIRVGKRLTAITPAPVIVAMPPKPVVAPPVAPPPVAPPPVAPPPVAPPPAPQAAPAPKLPEADVAEIRAALDAQVAAWNRNDLDQWMDVYWKSPEFEFVNGSTVTHGFQETSDYFRKNYVRGRSLGAIEFADVRIAGAAGGMASVNGRWHLTTADGKMKDGLFKLRMRHFPKDGWKAVRLKIPQTIESPPVQPASVAAAPPPIAAPPPAPAPPPAVVAKPAVVTPAAVAAAPPAAQPAPPPVPAPARVALVTTHAGKPSAHSRVAQILSGAAVLIFPHRLGEWLGLFDIGGGRGMMWFTEIDTIVFDAVLLFALLALAARSSAPWRNPLTWLVLLITLLVAAPLVYSINNFGTLFRLREMIYIGLLLTPLAVAAAEPSTFRSTA